MKENFIKEEKSKLINPVDYFNFFGSYISIFDGIKEAHIKNESEVCLNYKDNPANDKEPTFILKNNIVEVCRKNNYDIATGAKISKFMLLTAIKFKGDISETYSYVFYTLMKNEIPYVRVGTDYFKVFAKQDRYNAENEIIKAWKKDEIKQDHGKCFINHIPKYDDFTIIPDNLNYIRVKNNCFNLYSKFSHEPVGFDVNHNDIPITMQLINHIFGEQWMLGLQYLKVLYQYPTKILPILVLVSIERQTGKTTFLNYIQMLFGENSTLINPNDLIRDFNDAYAKKNIIMIDETVIDKSSSIEKLKSIATAKTMSVSEKFVSHYSIPFYGKILICTNKEKDFIRIDEEEIRFWIRKIKPITSPRNVAIEDDLFLEIPKFLKYLLQLPDPDFSQSRMVFTEEQIITENLTDVKEESKAGLMKELEILIEDYFNNSQYDNFEATIVDIKNKWFLHNNQVSFHYLKKILNEQMKKSPQKNKKYDPFNENTIKNKTGTPYLFVRKSEIATNDFDEPVPF